MLEGPQSPQNVLSFLGDDLGLPHLIHSSLPSPRPVSGSGLHSLTLLVGACMQVSPWTQRAGAARSAAEFLRFLFRIGMFSFVPAFRIRQGASWLAKLLLRIKGKVGKEFLSASA